MAAPTPERFAPNAAGPHWNQTSFLAEDDGADPPEVPPRPVLEALGAADHATDQHTRRAALDRLARHLMEQAVQRGRTPVPKRAVTERTSRRMMSHEVREKRDHSGSEPHRRG